MILKILVEFSCGNVGNYIYASNSYPVRLNIRYFTQSILQSTKYILVDSTGADSV